MRFHFHAKTTSDCRFVSVSEDMVCLMASNSFLIYNSCVKGSQFVIFVSIAGSQRHLSHPQPELPVVARCVMPFVF